MRAEPKEARLTRTTALRNREKTMTMKIATPILALSVAAVSTLAPLPSGRAQSQGDPVAQETSAPPPPEQMEQLEFLAGPWICAGKRHATVVTPERPIRTWMRGELELDGFWLSLQSHELRTRENPAPTRGTYALTFDQVLNQFRGLWHDNTGGHSEQLSPGWVDGQLTFTGSYFAAGMQFPTRGTFVRKSSRQMSHTGEINLNGQWVTLVTEDCTR